MTVAELREALQGLAPETYVAAYRETENGTEFFDIAEATVSTGTPRRHENGQVGFTFSHDGPARWLLITIEEP